MCEEGFMGIPAGMVAAGIAGIAVLGNVISNNNHQWKITQESNSRSIVSQGNFNSVNNSNSRSRGRQLAF